jgi:hypothetical protein
MLYEAKKEKYRSKEKCRRSKANRPCQKVLNQNQQRKTRFEDRPYKNFWVGTNKEKRDWKSVRTKSSEPEPTKKNEA